MKPAPLLYPLFDYLRRNNFQLGITEYVTAIKTLRNGFGLESPAKLKEVCRLLWAKSEEEQIRFDEAFSVFVEPLLVPIADDTETHEEDELDYNQSKTIGEKKKKTPPEKDIKADIENALEMEKKSYMLHPVSFTSSISLEPALIQKEKKYFFVPHLPMECRDMALIWGQLRNFKIPAKTEELDVEATIKEISRTGFFLGAKLKTHFQYQIKLILLLDREKSMIPFSLLIDALEKSFGYSSVGNEIKKFYFQGAPGNYLYEDPHLTKPVLKEHILEPDKRKLILIVSDAGAARGYYDEHKVRKTREFICFLSDNNFLYAWLNPIPSYRWKRTTAEGISHFVPMFSIDREGLSNAVKIFKGHYLPSKENLRANHDE